MAIDRFNVWVAHALLLLSVYNHDLTIAALSVLIIILHSASHT